MIIVVMGVAGAGKTTVGRLLARDLGWPFHDADAFHPPGNVEKMRRGVPLTDADRAPWLAEVRRRIDVLLAGGRSAVIACSALKRAYRDRLAAGRPEVRFVYLKGDFDLIRDRLERRRGHYVKADLIASQFAALEEPEDALVVDAEREPEALVAAVRRDLGI